MPDPEQDDFIRAAAFEHVQKLSERFGHLTANLIAQGFTFQGERIPLTNPQRGIYKPQRMNSLLSIKTVFPRPGRKIWYDDQRQVHTQIFSSTETVDYAFMGDNPDAAENRAMLDAYERRIPIIYFLGVSPGCYQAVIPTYIVDFDRTALKVRLAFVPEERGIYDFPEEAPERRYALREIQQRLHQGSFREAVILAYQGRCAISGLPETRLLDAAHIIEDRDVDLGHPVVPNGLPLSKIHHAAFDAHLIGIDPDYRIHVSDQLLSQNDGPMLEALKGIAGQDLRLPKRHIDWPDKDRLAQRFEKFKAVA